jgi:hypothetical protein
MDNINNEELKFKLRELKLIGINRMIQDLEIIEIIEIIDINSNEQ